MCLCLLECLLAACFASAAMRYENVCVESFAHTLPEQIVSSAEIEQWLQPLYQRLRLPEGRLELMTGIGQRRFWPPGTLPSQQSAITAEKALAAAGLDRRHVGALVHGSVCRDLLEPATACRVHKQLGLPQHCLVYDISNACLGLLNGVLQVADMIELGHIAAGLVVGTEDSRSLVEATVAKLNADITLSRSQTKSAMASLTIGSGSAAILLVHSALSRTGNRLLGGVAWCNSAACHLCEGDQEDAAGPLMSTDSETLLHEGVALAQRAFAEFLAELGWRQSDVHKTFCHQVGRAHQKLLLERLNLEPTIDYCTYPWLGNTGSVALPITAAIGIDSGHVQPGDNVALLGIGSGLNVIMLGMNWRESASGL